tara:strand:- start:283 stop:1494 length:1212 start_codon:yes stop_codon:yes gene_type:complete
MLNSPFSPWPSFSKKEAKKVNDILLSNRVNYWTGQECKKFEIEFAKSINSKFGIALSNGTIALELALIALDIKEGDEVLVTPRSFVASASSIVNVGAKPVFIDVDLNSQNICPKEILKAINSKTKAIICVHLGGWPCEMDQIMEIAKKNKLFVIEDCAQAHGALFKGKHVGTFGDVGCWSFCQDKIMTTAGEGGMLCTNNKKIWERVWSMKDHGKSYEKVYSKTSKTGFRWLHESFGSNYRMTEIQAAVGRIQLKELPSWTEKRNKNQNLIWKTAEKINGFNVPRFNDNLTQRQNKKKVSVHAGYKCYISVDLKKIKKNWSRNKIIDEINKLGVPCFQGSCSEIYLEKSFREKKLQPKKRLTNAKLLGDTSIAFLIHPTLKNSEIKKTCKALKIIGKEAFKRP